MKVAIAGTGHVGLLNAMLLSQNHEVVALDIIPEKIEQLNNKISTMVDAEIEDFLANKDLNFTETLDKEPAYKGANFAIIAIPTDYDIVNNCLIPCLLKRRFRMLLISILMQYDYQVNCVSWLYAKY